MPLRQQIEPGRGVAFEDAVARAAACHAKQTGWSGPFEKLPAAIRELHTEQAREILHAALGLR